MELVEPTPEYSDSFADALAEFEQENIKGFWNAGTPLTVIQEYIERTKRQRLEIDVPAHWVPSSTFWLIDNDIFVAHVNIRHRLNDFLKQMGGHIGYAVRPSRQGQGYGSKILEYAIPKAQELGIENALFTCDPGNHASRKIIEKNGGSFVQHITHNDKPIMQFIINTHPKQALE